MKLENRHIFITSTEPWGDVWYSKHNYAVALSDKNKVFFINPPLRWKPAHLFSNKLKSSSYSNSLTILSYHNFFPFTGKVNFILQLNELLVARLFKKFIRENACQSPVFWHFDPFGFHHPKLAGAEMSIFHIVDEYTSFQGVFRLVKNVDVLLCVSQKFANDYKHSNKPLKVIPHGIFPPKKNLDELLSIVPKKEIVFIGTLSQRIDFELLYLTAIQFYGHNLKLIGPINSSDFDKEDYRYLNKLKSLSNVVLTGAKTFADLQRDIITAELCIAPYKMDMKINKINSLKIIQYLSYGKNTVTTFFEDYQPHIQQNNNLLYMAETKDEFLGLCEKILSQNSPDKKYVEQRFDFASSYHYTSLIKTIEDFINKTKPS